VLQLLAPPIDIVLLTMTEGLLIGMDLVLRITVHRLNVLVVHREVKRNSSRASELWSDLLVSQQHLVTLHNYFRKLTLQFL
jgi:hypothetical protein